jgi:tRNA threonylcarbamoyladenosine biosynthesis protein TsaB
MIVLGFDTATHATAVALALGDGRVLHSRDDPPPQAHPGHATRLLGMADGLLLQARIQWTSLERIAVGVGPGRFTGLRVGIATARGLAQALGIELAGVSTLEALAQEAARADGAGHVGILAVIDARRGEVFAGAFERGDGSARAAEPALVPLTDPASPPLAPERLAEVSGSLVGRSGAEAGWLAVGDGAVLARAQLEAAGVAVPPDESPLHALHARAICELGARSVPAARLDQILPDYRRMADVREAGREPAAREPAVLAQGATSS